MYLLLAMNSGLSQFCTLTLSIEVVCMAKKEKEDDGGEVVVKSEVVGVGEGGMEEEMEGVKAEGSASTGRALNIRDKWMLTHEITPLANELLNNGGVSA